MADQYPSSMILRVSTEVARREMYCRLRCTAKGCGGNCHKSSKAYLDSLSTFRQVEYNAYMRAKPMLDMVTA